MKQEPETQPPEPPEQEETSIKSPKKGTERRAFGRIDREHPIGGEMSDILGGILLRARLPWLLSHHSQVAVLALFSFINGCISIGLMSALAVLTHSPFVFLHSARPPFCFSIRRRHRVLLRATPSLVTPSAQVPGISASW